MQIQALKFVADTRQPESVELPADSAEVLEAALQVRPAAAYLIGEQDLDRLRALETSIADRGVKNPHKGLAAYFLRDGSEPVALIDGNYTNAGQLVRGVHALLKRAREKGVDGCYVVGTSRQLFDEVTAGRPQDAAGESIEAESSFSTEHPARRLFELMGDQDEPPELAASFVGQSANARFTRRLIMAAARVDNPVLILGDTGTGKELVARSIHHYSNRSHEKFIAVNCGAIPTELLESELFGHEKGAFTHATVARDGLWRLAARGTLFLDEIADLSLTHQVKILRALEDGRIRPVGAASDIDANARVICATNRDLFSMAQAGEFREDLYYRLLGFIVRTSPLREHPEDVALLAQEFWRRITLDDNARLPTAVLAQLQSYAWPGNARELRTVLANLHALFPGQEPSEEHLRAIFYLEGQRGELADGPPSEKDFALHRAQCLRHLRRVEEAVRATKATVATLLDGGKALAGGSGFQSLGFQLADIEGLCSRPLLFHSELSYQAVRKLLHKLMQFQGMLQGDVGGAKRYWETEVAEEIKLVTSVLFREVEQLLAKG